MLHAPVPSLAQLILTSAPLCGIAVDHDQFAAHVAAALLGDVAELLAVDAQHGLHVVQQRVALRLLVEAALAPALAVVVDLALAGDVVLVQQVVLRRRQQAHRLREGLHRVVGQRARGLLAQDLEMPALHVVLHVRQRPHRKAHRGLLALLHDVSWMPLATVDDLPRRRFLAHHFGRVRRRLFICFFHRSTSLQFKFSTVWKHFAAPFAPLSRSPRRAEAL